MKLLPSANYLVIDRYEKARQAFIHNLGRIKATTTESGRHYSAELFGLGLVYLRLGDYGRAEEITRDSLSQLKSRVGADDPFYAVFLQQVAQRFSAIGDYSQAAAYLREAVAILVKAHLEDHPKHAACLEQLASTLIAQQDYDAAAPLLNQAYQIRKKHFGDTHPEVAKSLESFSEFFMQVGQYADAERYRKESMRLNSKLLAEEGQTHASNLYSLAWIYHLDGRVEQAEKAFEEALGKATVTLGEHNPRRAVYLESLAFVQVARGNYASAGPLYRTALHLCRGDLENSALAQSEWQQLRMMAKFRHALDRYVVYTLKADANPAEVYEEVLSWKGATLSRQRAIRRAADDPKVSQVLDKLQVAARHLATISQSVPVGAEGKQVWREQVRQAVQEKERLETQLSQLSEAFRDANRKQTLNDVRAVLPQKGAIVDFLEVQDHVRSDNGVWKSNRRLVAFVVRAGGDPTSAVRIFDLGPMQPISEAIATWRKSLGQSREAAEAASLLRSRLWEPIGRALDDADLVLVSPDAELATFPFAALPGSKPQTYLIEDVNLAVLPSPRFLLNLNSVPKAPQQSKGILLLGGVDYLRAKSGGRSPTGSVNSLAEAELQRLRGSWNWSPIPGTAREIEAIRRMYEKGRLDDDRKLIELQGDAATEAALRRGMTTSSILHLATHGFFAAEKYPSPENTAGNTTAPPTLDFEDQDGLHERSPGILSGIVLAGANRPELPESQSDQPAAASDDGIMTADEVVFLPLDHVELVVLSACETGLGVNQGGEGLLGLQRAFHVAGADTTVASLWKVSDDATERLMARFHENISQRKNGRLEALREAQLWMLRKGGQPQSDGERGLTRIDSQPVSLDGRLPPYYWAAFVLSGDWR